MKMSRIDRQGYANYLGLSDKEARRIPADNLRHLVAQNLPVEREELQTVNHKRYTLPGDLQISTRETIRLLRTLTERESGTDAYGSFVTSYFNDPSEITGLPDENSKYRGTHIEAFGEWEIQEEDLDYIESGEYEEETGYVLAGRTITFVSGRYT